MLERKMKSLFERDFRSVRSAAWMLLGTTFGWGVMGCAASPAAVAHPNGATSASSPAEVTTLRTVVSPQEAVGIDELCARADRDLAAGRLEDAVSGYERVLELDSAGPLVPRALFGSATARDLLGEHAEALARYQHVAGEFPSAPEAHPARVRSVRLFVHLERYAEAGQVARGLLAGQGVTPLRPLEAIAAYGAVALDHAARGDDAAAYEYVEKGRNVVEAHGLDPGGKIPRDLAALDYAAGEVRRLRAERITFVPLPANFGAKLEERCQLLLDAQSAYSAAMRAEDAHWSAMAGFRVGELYETLHTEVMRAPTPPAADTEERRLLFEGAMRLRYAILLEKAKTMMKHTLAMVERTHEPTPWAERARASERSIEEAILREQAALARLPYTRAELQSALDDLQARTRLQNSPSAPSPGAVGRKAAPAH
jgi:tetratricopeptide (TPR) repeat protein